MPSTIPLRTCLVAGIHQFVLSGSQSWRDADNTTPEARAQPCNVSRSPASSAIIALSLRQPCQVKPPQPCITGIAATRPRPPSTTRTSSSGSASSSSRPTAASTGLAPTSCETWHQQSGGKAEAWRKTLEPDTTACQRFVPDISRIILYRSAQVALK